MAVNTQPTDLRASLHAWLDEAEARSLIGEFGSSDDVMDHLAAHHIDSLRKLIGDRQVIGRTAKAVTKLAAADGADAALVAAQRFLVDACWICSERLVSSPPPPGTAATRSEVLRELTALAGQTAALAKKLRDYGKARRHATSPRYLSDRHQAGNPVGFNRERKGWSESHYSEPALLPLEDLLECMAADVLEEAALLQVEIGARRQEGGKSARYYRQIDMLATASKRLSTEQPSRPDAQLVFEVMCVLLGPSTADDIDVRTVRARLNR